MQIRNILTKFCCENLFVFAYKTKLFTDLTLKACTDIFGLCAISNLIDSFLWEIILQHSNVDCPFQMMRRRRKAAAAAAAPARCNERERNAQPTTSESTKKKRGRSAECEPGSTIWIHLVIYYYSGPELPRHRSLQLVSCGVRRRYAHSEISSHIF